MWILALYKNYFYYYYHYYACHISTTYAGDACPVDDHLDLSLDDNQIEHVEARATLLIKT